MLGLEAAVLFLVFVILITYARETARPAEPFRDFLLLAANAWALEESSILFYRYYAYSPVWTLFLDRVPAAVVAVWPVVILSAREMAHQIASGKGRARLMGVGGLIVLADAALIEPLAVGAGLWSWKTGGLFGVPPIGIFGWGCFAALGLLALEIRAGAEAKRGVALAAGTIPLVGVHGMLVASWWGLFKWVDGPIDPLAVTSCAWILSLLLTARILSRGTGSRISRSALLRRLPAAGLLFSLFWFMEAPPKILVVYAGAFVPPYLALMGRQYGLNVPRRG